MCVVLDFKSSRGIKLTPRRPANAQRGNFQKCWETPFSKMKKLFWPISWIDFFENDLVVQIIWSRLKSIENFDAIINWFLN